MRSYLEGDAATVAYIDRHVFLLWALYDHKRFKYDIASQVRDGVKAALVWFYNVWQGKGQSQEPEGNNKTHGAH